MATKTKTRKPPARRVTKGGTKSTPKGARGTFKRKQTRRKRYAKRKFPENVLIAFAWMLVPMFILPFEWRRLHKAGRIMGSIWTCVMLWMVYGHQGT